MYTLVLYDIRDDSVRDKARRLLLKHGFTPLNKSAYVGASGRGEREYLARRLSQLAGEGDIIVLLQVSSEQLRRAIFIVRGEVWNSISERGVIVVGGPREES
ncbi:MAG: CRISPR-associated endonuclease Cas2 [Desulfurococcales archaeon]|nr:CRISPR-associated endonuclease Cas2 [Desulfurococcales archaeon]